MAEKRIKMRARVLRERADDNGEKQKLLEHAKKKKGKLGGEERTPNVVARE